MRNLKSLATGLALAAMLGTGAMAGPASERVFSTKALELLNVGQQVIYTHTRTGQKNEELRGIDDGEIRVALKTATDGSREAVVTMGEKGKLRPVSIWPASSGNPILPIFLESALRTMARTTGGSTFYIRNRIKDALGNAGTMTPVTLNVQGKELPATEIVFEPFRDDKNSERMGPWATMTLTFIVSEELPGDIVRFVAATAPAGDETIYHEEIAFANIAKADAE